MNARCDRLLAAPEQPDDPTDRRNHADDGEKQQ
jgi:hypothetical protein